MVTIVHPEEVWSARKTVGLALVIATTSVVAFWRVFGAGRPMGGSMPDWFYFALVLGVALVYPFAPLVIFFKRVYRPRLAVVYVLTLGAGWHLTMFCCLTLEYGLWAGFLEEERTLINFVASQGKHLAGTVAFYALGGMLIWGAWRLVRGKPLVQDGTICERCGYSLIGNVSGRCPECGTPHARRNLTPRDEGVGPSSAGLTEDGP